MSSSDLNEEFQDRSFLRLLFSSTAWQGAGLLFSNMASFMTKLVLARLLVPEHFGIVGMAVVFTGFIQTIEKLGIEDALVQRKDGELTDVDIFTGHRAAIVVGLLFYVLIVIPGAPAVAWFYDEPRLTSVVLVLAIPVLIDPFGIFQKILLKRDLRFKELAKIEMFATFLGAVVAIIMAFAGAGVWALVAQWLVFSAVTVATLRILYAPPPKARFCFSSLRRTLRYGGYITGQRIFSFISKQSDYLIVGRMVGAASLGAYTIAFLLTDAIRSKLMTALSRVLFSAYSRIQTDIGKVNRYYLGSIRFSVLLVAPILCAFFFYGEELLIYGFGDEWHAAVEPLRLLAVAALIHTVGGTNSTALKAVDKPELSFKVRMFESMCVMIPGLLIGVHYFGLVGAGAAVIASKIASRLAFHYFMRKIIGTTEIQVLRAIGPGMVAVVFMGVALVILRHLWTIDSLLQTVSFIMLGGIVYTCVALPMIFGDIRELWRRTR